MEPRTYICFWCRRTTWPLKTDDTGAAAPGCDCDDEDMMMTMAGPRETREAVDRTPETDE